MRPFFFLHLVCFFPPCQIIFGAGSAEHENSNKSPEAWNKDCVTGSQSQPDLPSPARAAHCVYCAVLFVCFLIQSSLHVAPQRRWETPSDASRCGAAAHAHLILVTWGDFEAFKSSRLSSRAPWCHNSLVMAGDRRAREGFFYPSILLPLLLLHLFLEATLIGIDFLLMSCHAKGFQRGNTTLCRRQPGQAATKAVTKIPPMKADTSFRKFWERALSGALEW